MTRTHAENFHPDEIFEFDYFLNQQHRYIPDHQQQLLCNSGIIVSGIKDVCIGIMYYKYIGKYKKYLGNLNWPSSDPSVPKEDKTRPFTSKI